LLHTYLYNVHSIFVFPFVWLRSIDSMYYIRIVITYGKYGFKWSHIYATIKYCILTPFQISKLQVI